MRKLSALEFPRQIQPEMLEAGDLITVTLPESRGVVMSKRARIHRRVDHGDMRQWLNEENVVILTWQPDKRATYTITLHERQARQGEALFDVELYG